LELVPCGIGGFAAGGVGRVAGAQWRFRKSSSKASARRRPRATVAPSPQPDNNATLAAQNTQLTLRAIIYRRVSAPAPST